MPSQKADGEVTEFGFRWGVLDVERTCELPEGRLCVTLKTPRQTISVYTSRTGLLRVFSADGREWKPEGKR